MNLQRENKTTGRQNNPDWFEHGFTLPNVFDDFVTRDLFRPSFSTTGVSTPAINIIETNNDFRLEMVAPGMKKENFKVEVDKGTLTVSYEHDDNREGDRKDWKYTRREYNYHSFSRSFSLPDTVDVNSIQAKYEDGILNLILPKKDDARTKPAKQIKVL
jgi:HSP20 family protein